MNADRRSTPSRVCGVLATVTLLIGLWATSHASAEEPTTPATGKPLTAESLGTMLEAMGFEPKPVKLEGGQLIQTLTVNQEGWKIYCEVSIGFDGSRVWVVAPLSTVESVDKVPQSILMKMLEENFNNQPITFAYMSSVKKIDLIRTLENKGVTPAGLRTAIESVLETVRRTEPLWNVKKWPSETSAAK